MPRLTNTNTMAATLRHSQAQPSIAHHSPQLSNSSPLPIPDLPRDNRFRSMFNDGNGLLKEYVLSTQLLTDGGPIRCITVVPDDSSSSSLELISGSQDGVVSRIVVSSSLEEKKTNANDVNGSGNDDGLLLEIQPGGTNTRHPHQITAILSSSQCVSAAGSTIGEVYVTGCKDGNVRVMDGKSHELKYVLEGHSNAVASLSWIPSLHKGDAPWLVSGSWDGTAKVWSIAQNSPGCLGTLGGHESMVSVAGLPPESGAIRKIVTVSARVTEGTPIPGHTVRIWRLTSSSDDSLALELMAQVSNDHAGPMRDVVYDPGTRSIYACSNDGVVQIYSADDGTCETTLSHPRAGRPMFLSLCVVGDSRTRAVVAGAEDGSVVVWNFPKKVSDGVDREAQVIAHPGCVWRVAALRPASSGFVTACDDGRIRIFTRHASKSAPLFAPEYSLKPASGWPRELAGTNREPSLGIKVSAKKVYGTSRPKEKKVKPVASLQVFDDALKDRRKQKENDAKEDVTVITFGGRGSRGDASTAQNIGNYRMLIDDLSYLCSAIIHCRSKPVRSDKRPAPAVCKHSHITAGAACDIAELVSRSDTRSALLIVSAQALKSAGGERGGARVGALEAVLESIACAPCVSDLSRICRQLVDQPSFPLRMKEGTQQNQVGGVCKGYADNHFDFEPVQDGPKNKKRILNTSANEGSKPVMKSTDNSAEPVGESERYDVISSKALSIVSYFVGIDCTGSDRAAILPKNRSSRFVVDSARKSVLQHKAVLQGIARLVSHDPVVHSYLNEASNTSDSDNTCLDDLWSNEGFTETLSEQPSDSLVSLDGNEESSITHCDPTKQGRRSRKRKKHRLSSNSAEPSRPEIPKEIPSLATFESNFSSHHSRSMNHEKFSDKFSPFDFSPKDGTASCHKPTELNSCGKYEEKISLALSRAKLANVKENSIFIPKSEVLSHCNFCKIWASNMINNELGGYTSTSNLAILAADCIITGRDRFYALFDARDDEDDSYDHHLDGLMTKNPIVYANEMLRQSGSLPYYSRSMSETLVAILLSSKGNTHGNGGCSNCITYLQRRATLLSEVLDSLCCLSPNVSAGLSRDEFYLVPSLLRTIAELAFGIGDNASPLCSESTTTALKTLTSLTHENSAACEQIIRSYPWKIPLPSSSQGSTSSRQIIGLDIVFSYLFKAASLKPESYCASHKSNYDNIIFCLNILTNIVEMVPNPTKKLIETIVVDEGFMHAESSAKTSGLTWLVRWVVSKTSGFQNSVMKGSFGGSTVETHSATDANDELKAGEEGNLVTSGNGFVLLAYLMMDDENFPSKNIRGSILKELPIDRNGNCRGIQFMVKTLKAFCNFYHYSVGDLSVAVIGPVVKLISGLEKIDLAEQQAKWPQIYED